VLPWGGSDDLQQRSSLLWGSVSAATSSDEVDPPHFDMTYTQSTAVHFGGATDAPATGITRLRDEVTVLFTVDFRNPLLLCLDCSTAELTKRIVRDCAFGTLRVAAGARGLEYCHDYAVHPDSPHLMDVWATVQVLPEGITAVQVTRRNAKRPCNVHPALPHTWPRQVPARGAAVCCFQRSRPPPTRGAPPTFHCASRPCHRAQWPWGRRWSWQTRTFRASVTGAPICSDTTPTATPTATPTVTPTATPTRTRRNSSSCSVRASAPWPCAQRHWATARVARPNIRDWSRAAG